MVSAGRIGRPADAARGVLCLAGPASDDVTWRDVGVDGGLSQALLGLLPPPGFDDA